jgi:hypothetical protein
LQLARFVTLFINCAFYSVFKLSYCFVKRGDTTEDDALQLDSGLVLDQILSGNVSIIHI